MPFDTLSNMYNQKAIVSVFIATFMLFLRKRGENFLRNSNLKAYFIIVSTQSFLSLPVCFTNIIIAYIYLLLLILSLSCSEEKWAFLHLCLKQFHSISIYYIPRTYYMLSFLYLSHENFEVTKVSLIKNIQNESND